MAEFSLTDLIDVSVLQQIQDGFSEYTGMAALTTDADGVPVTKGSGFTSFCMDLTRQSRLGFSRCNECDRNGALRTFKERKPTAYTCHAGLVDFAAPIMVGDKIIGSFIGGQVRTEEIDEKKFRKTAKELRINPDKYVEAAKQTGKVPMEQVLKASAFLAEIAKVLSEMAYRNYLALQNSYQLERAARSQSIFVMNMSTDMKQKVEEWMSCVDDALESKDVKVYEDALKELKYGSSVLYSNLESTIGYIQMSTGEVELAEDEYNLRDFMNQQINIVRLMYEDRKIYISLKVAEEAPEYLLGDSGRIGQIINKLMVNIISCCMDDGEINVSVDVHKKNYATDLIIRISSHTCVMTEEYRQKIDEYIHKDALLSMEKEESSELGFSIIHHLIHQISGNISVESSEDSGTVFVITIPQLAVEGGMKDAY